MYMRNRYYNPATGQFTQPDPIGLAGGLNSYGFAAGDPVSYSDPYGLCPPIKRCLGNILHSHYKMGDMLHAGRHIFIGTLRSALGEHTNRDQMIVAGTIVITREANRLVGERSEIYNANEQNAFRHIYGSCEVTRAFGIGEAREITNAHERTLHSQDDAEKADSRADRANNTIGHMAGTSEARQDTGCGAILAAGSAKSCSCW
ncbi:MAG TPA: RHS repeat-associated core domain-containing protein [Longimicrobium sp.]|nr:RHS repeat-associated core domain-containing protein [Longimicrobium sp.]